MYWVKRVCWSVRSSKASFRCAGVEAWFAPTPDCAPLVPDASFSQDSGTGDMNIAASEPSHKFYLGKAGAESGTQGLCYD